MSDVATTTALADVSRTRAPSAASPVLTVEGHGKHVADDSRGRSRNRWEAGCAGHGAWAGRNVGLGFSAEEMSKRTVLVAKLYEPGQTARASVCSR